MVESCFSKYCFWSEKLSLQKKYFEKYFIGRNFRRKKFLDFGGIYPRGCDNSSNFAGINFRGYGHNLLDISQKGLRIKAERREND